MFCMNCGKQLPENAKFCMFCGSAIPSSDQIPNKCDEIKSDPLLPKEQITFSIKGQTISFDPSYSRYTELRSQFLKDYYAYMEAPTHDTKTTLYDGNQTTKSSCLQQILDYGKVAAEWSSNRAIKILIDHQIFDVTAEDLLNKAPLVNFQGVYSRFEEKYLSIVATEEDLARYREFRRENRSRWQGGGFGISGAIKGAATAGVLNLGGSIISGIGSVISGALDSREIRSRITQLFAETDWMRGFWRSLRDDSIAIFECMYQILDQHGVEAAPPINKAVAKAYFENAEKVTDRDQILSILIMSVQANPYFPNAYGALFKQVGFLNDDVCQLIAFFQPSPDWITYFIRPSILRNKIDYSKETFETLDKKINFLEKYIATVQKKAEYNQLAKQYLSKFEKNDNLVLEELKSNRLTVDSIQFENIEALNNYLKEKELLSGYEDKLESLEDDESKYATLVALKENHFIDPVCSENAQILMKKYMHLLDEAEESEQLATSIDNPCENDYMETCAVEKDLSENDKDLANSNISKLLDLAEQGNADAQIKLGHAYLFGENVEKNEDIAFAWIQKAAEQNNEDAKAHLGYCYLLGKHVEKDENRAYKILRKSAKQKNVYGQTWLGLMLYNGNFASDDFLEEHGDFATALNLLTMASDAGNTTAEVFLASLFEEGKLVERDLKKAIKLYERASNQGDYVACNNLARYYEKGKVVPKDIEKAKILYLKALEKKDDFRIKKQLANLYYNQENYEESAKLYLEAALAGDSNSQMWIARFYRDGTGVQQNYKAAIDWFTKGAQQGNASCQNSLGYMYENGIGVTQDYNESVKWYQEASNNGNLTAKNNLALMFENGKGVEKDHKKAIALLKESALAGDEDAPDIYKSIKRFFDF